MCVHLKRIGEASVNTGVSCIVEAVEILDHEGYCSGMVIKQFAFPCQGFLDDEVRVFRVPCQDVKIQEHLEFGVE